MIGVVAALNITLGLVYCQYGTMTIIEMKRGWRTLGFSHFGAAWIFMAFTCGPHHLVHGLHLAVGGHPAGVLDLIVVLIGFPAGVAWFLLRVEAFNGGRGDRFMPGNPLWLMLVPMASSAYLTAIGAALVGHDSTVRFAWFAVPNVLLVGIYMTIGYYLVRTQIGNRNPLGGWSLSGVSLATIFPTCAIMHGIFAYYATTGLYRFEIGEFVIDCLAVPSGLYFLWVVHGLYRNAIRDWNRDTPSLAQPVVAGR